MDYGIDPFERNLVDISDVALHHGAFLAVLNQSQTVATAQILIPKSGSYSSLHDVLAAMNHD